jgi:serine/threonine protein kinase
MTNTLKNYLSTSSINDRPKDVKEFKIKYLIGKGSFGKVFLVQRKDKIYAMKTIRKDLLLEKTLITHCLLEKEVLMKTKHPFVVNMEHVFQTENRIFFIM